METQQKRKAELIDKYRTPKHYFVYHNDLLVIGKNNGVEALFSSVLDQLLSY